MASFIIHTIVGETLLNEIERKYNITISDYNRKNFLLGNLIPDSLKTDKTIPSTLKEDEITAYKIEIKNKIRHEKLTTHFRNPEKEGDCLKIPDTNRFISKYESLIQKDISVLGYLFHLYTDRIFFSKLFPETFDSLGFNKEPVNTDNELVYIRIKKNNQLIDAKEFWAGTSTYNIYNDYTVMNKILLERFSTSFNLEDFTNYAQEYFINPGIKEVSYEKIIKLLKDTQKYIEESFQQEEKELKVFTETQIIEFVHYVVEQFMIEYEYILNMFEQEKKKTK